MRAFRTVAILTCLAAALAPGATLAQKVMKYVMPDGRVVYSDTPVPGGRLQSELAPPPPADPAGAPPAEPVQPAPTGAPRQPLADRTQLLNQATAELSAANAALAAAQQQLANGKEPLPGERTGTASGASRLNDAYWARQAANEAAVAQARQRLAQAQAELNRLR
jgi:hypothetical protein